MNHLAHYVAEKATLIPQPCEGAADVIFFSVKLKDQPSAGALRELIAAHRGEFTDIDLFDGREHNFLSIGAWAGDQRLALTLMGMGELLGLWKLLTPRSVLGATIPDELVRQMAGVGYVSIQAPSVPQSIPEAA